MTKQNVLLQKQHQNSAKNHSQSVERSQFSNFNLNQSYKCSVPVKLFSKTKNDKHSGHTVTDNSQVKEKPWNKSTKNLNLITSKNPIFTDESKKADQKYRKNNKNDYSNKNNSTLSLHIAAYENTIEIKDLPKESEASTPKVQTHQDSFEFPRQMDEKEHSKPEIQQFKASQKLFSPNQDMTSWFFVHSKQALSIRRHNKSRQFIFADSFFGFMLCVFLMSIEWAPLLWGSLLTSVQYMEQLLGWIQETPAGLKLNSQLSYVLSSFFRYHLHLCRTYVLSWSIHPIRYLPLLAPFVGATVFIGIFVDILALVTIHLRCFHLYGHRLASLSWTAIRSTFYAFQEKKWNPLRHRVDYVHLDFRQRLFATLEFLFLVALLPTIAIYCLVFSGLFIVFDSICKLLVYGVKIFQQTFLKSQKSLEEK